MNPGANAPELGRVPSARTRAGPTSARGYVRAGPDSPRRQPGWRSASGTAAPLPDGANGLDAAPLLLGRSTSPGTDEGPATHQSLLAGMPNALSAPRTTARFHVKQRVASAARSPPIALKPPRNAPHTQPGLVHPARPSLQPLPSSPRYRQPDHTVGDVDCAIGSHPAQPHGVAAGSESEVMPGLNSATASPTTS